MPVVEGITTTVVRLTIFDDSRLWRLLVWISASGTPLASMRPDSLRSSIFDDFGSGRLPGWISSFWAASREAPARLAQIVNFR